MAAIMFWMVAMVFWIIARVLVGSCPFVLHCFLEGCYGVAIQLLQCW